VSHVIRRSLSLLAVVLVAVITIMTRHCRLLVVAARNSHTTTVARHERSHTARSLGHIATENHWQPTKHTATCIA
jgi:hypothetical protein